MAKLTADDVLKLAQLSKLELTDEQVEKFRIEIEAIVDYIEILDSADVAGLRPTDQVSGLHNALRTDEVQQYSTPTELLKNLPDREGDLIKVKRMIG